MNVNPLLKTTHNVQVSAPRTGYEYLIDTLADWGVKLYAGITGGGVIHLLKHIEPLSEFDGTHKPAFFSVGEYVAGFIPLGYYLAGGTPSAAVATTGAATRLLTCGLSDAKLHNIPAIYLIPLSPADTRNRAPLQDTSPEGANVVAQLQAELPSGTFVLDDPDCIEDQLEQAHRHLNHGAPIVLVMAPEALGKPIPGTGHNRPGGSAVKSNGIDQLSLAQFLDEFPQQSIGRRVIVLAGEEAAMYPGMPALTTSLCKALQAPIVWSINGANAIARDNPFGFGYLGFGGNDRAMELWRSIDSDDIVITLGFCPDEYTLNFADVPACITWNFTNMRAPYGSVNGEFRHRVQGQYFEVRGPIDQVLKKTLEGLPSVALSRPSIKQPFADDLNSRQILPPRHGTVDIVRFYQELDNLWQPESIAFDDVCLAYKDRQYVTQRPHPNVRFHSLYRGSAMGGALGTAIGARLARPDATVFAFTGDGCFRLVAGCLAEAQSMGIVLFVLDNGSLGIMEQGLPVVIPDYSSSRYHHHLARIDFSAMARACGWTSYKLEPDLSNLVEIMRAIYGHGRQSILVEVPVDAQQVVGQNPRANNL